MLSLIIIISNSSFISFAQTADKMTSIEVPVTLEAPSAPKIAKRKVKAAEKAEKVHKKIAKSKSKGRKF